MAHKAYVDWKGSLDNYLKVGDTVDEGLVEHFRDVAPPVTNRSTIVQIGEPYGSREEGYIYSTIEKTSEGWVYRGVCYRGQVQDMR